jgi:hypothetical protein
MYTTPVKGSSGTVLGPGPSSIAASLSLETFLPFAMFLYRKVPMQEKQCAAELDCKRWYLQ